MYVGTLRKSTTPRICAITVTIDVAGPRSHGNVTMRGCTLEDYAKTATLMTITEKEDWWS